MNNFGFNTGFGFSGVANTNPLNTNLPLNTNTDLVKGLGPVSFQRSSKQYIQDFEGNYRPVYDNCPAFPGSRVVTNYIPNNLTGWSGYNTNVSVSGTLCTVIAGGGNKTLTYGFGGFGQFTNRSMLLSFSISAGDSTVVDFGWWGNGGWSNTITKFSKKTECDGNITQKNWQFNDCKWTN